VLVAGSHGGIIAGYYGASAGVLALILNDAGVGKDAAGIAALPYLAAIGMAAATVSHLSARIGDGADMLARGVISHLNAVASALGVARGMRCEEAAQRLCVAKPPHSPPLPYAEGRFVLADGVLGLDSIGMLEARDAGNILVIGSHGALHGGRPESALGVAARAAVFNDADVGADAVGITRLPVLDARAIPAATVDCMSARIGDARSMWESGVVSHVNAHASRFGVRVGQTVREFAAQVAAA
jgi:uncharacterized protein YunC (DUF1805 family)